MNRGRGCRSNEHHAYFPKKAYTTPLEKAYRDLFTEQMCVWEHDSFHEFAVPPEKPDLLEMIAALTVPLEVEVEYAEAA